MLLYRMRFAMKIRYYRALTRYYLALTVVLRLIQHSTL